MDYQNDEVIWRAHWRLMFDVICSVPRMQQEITIWQTNTPTSGPFQRLAYQIKTLAPTNMNGVAFGPDYVQLIDGFIEYQTDLDQDIRALISNAGLPSPEELGTTSESIGGENIYIRADISLGEGGSLRDYPVFFFPQNEAYGVQLRETFDGVHQAHWGISNQVHVPQRVFSLEKVDVRHRLRVRQGRESGVDLFNTYCDNTPLDILITSASHDFAPGGQTFYLGCLPHEGMNFIGEIYCLEFDPNNSCVACPRPAVIEPRDR
ncbi:MAG TPA: hypothetical protein PKJ56_07755 [Promineifilum sp.]|nr:hypothetical protein [Promineifilum sp.]